MNVIFYAIDIHTEKMYKDEIAKIWELIYNGIVSSGFTSLFPSY